MGVIAILVEIGFGIWAAVGKPWYWYPISISVLFVAGSVFNTSFIQGITRCHSVFAVKGLDGLCEALRLGFITLIYWAVAYGISRIVFSDRFQLTLFFSACFILSLIVAVTSGEFRSARLRTQLFEVTPNADKVLHNCQTAKEKK